MVIFHHSTDLLVCNLLKMGTRIRFILFLSAILFQGIVAATEENINESSDLIREKRAFGHIPHLNSNPVVYPVSYIVAIRKRGVQNCAGAVITPNIILTAAHCVYDGGMTLSVLAESAHRRYGTFHTVKNLQTHPRFEPNTLANDLALLYVVPPINMGKGKGIPLYNGSIIQPGVRAIFGSWGCTVALGKNRTLHPKDVQLMPVPILSPTACGSTQEHICTGNNWGPQDKCFSSSGGPLTIAGQLVGIMSVPKGKHPNKNNPGEFVNLVHPAYKQWIISTVQHLQMIRG